MSDANERSLRSHNDKKYDLGGSLKRLSRNNADVLKPSPMIPSRISLAAASH